MLKRFNTASGKHCCNSFVTYGGAEGLFERFNTASGKHCCNHLVQGMVLLQSRVSIPQAVSTVATVGWTVGSAVKMAGFNTASGKHCCNRTIYLHARFNLIVSIPQAVSTVATDAVFIKDSNDRLVSIPQAVSTVATMTSERLLRRQ